MHIVMPPEPVSVFWEGELRPPFEMMYGYYAVQTPGPVRTTIGRPFQWADGQLLGEGWQPPVGGDRYYLLQLAFTLRPREGVQIASADFCIHLHHQINLQAVVFDAYPKEVLQEQAKSVILEIGPDFKLGVAEASLGKVGATIDFGVAVPIVRSEGLQEATFCWRFGAHRKHPLTGSRQMYAVVALPPGMSTTLASLDLIVAQESRFGPIRLVPPEKARTGMRWVIGEAQTQVWTEQEP